MRVFMLGWEFPPFISGGLGTACYGLTKAMSALGTDVLFVLPRPVATPFSTHVSLISPHSGSELAGPVTEFRLDEFEHVTFRTVDAQITSPYQTTASYQETIREVRKETRAVPVQTTRPQPAPPQPQPQAQPTTQAEAKPTQPEAHPRPAYAGDLIGEVQRYATLAAEVARNEKFEVVHAHDWMTYPAGLAVSAARGVPLVVHVHSTEFDRSGSNIDQRIYDIERRGMHAAQRVVAVSHMTKATICSQYGVSPERVDVIYNAIDTNGNGTFDEEKYKIHSDEKIVLFLGRMTMQKGPEYFLAAAKKVLDVYANVKFVMAGSGDLMRRTVEMANAMGIGHKVLFTGFLKHQDVDRVMKLADLYVMPSVSEPFGIAPLEAMSNDVPVLISKQSGVSEVLNHVLKVDFWDVDEMANKIVAVLKHPPLAKTLRQHGAFEVKKLSWSETARRCMELYDKVVKTAGTAAAPATVAVTAERSV